MQWLALNQFDQETLAIVLRSFRQVYPEAQLFLDGMHLALVGPRGHWQGAAALDAHLDRLAAEQRGAGYGGGRRKRMAGTLLGADRGECRADSSMNGRRSSNFCCRACTMVRGADVAPLLQSLLAQRPTIEQAATLLDVAAAQQEDFRRAYIGTEAARAKRTGELAGLHARGGSSARTCLRGRPARPLDRLCGGRPLAGESRCGCCARPAAASSCCKRY